MSKYLDLTGLQRYDSKIKQYISDHGGGADIGVVTITTLATSLTTAQYTEAQKDPAIIIEGSYIYTKTFDGGSGGMLHFIAYLNQTIKTISISSTRTITRSTYELPLYGHVSKSVIFSVSSSVWDQIDSDTYETELTEGEWVLYLIYTPSTGELDFGLKCGEVRLDVFKPIHILIEDMPSSPIQYDFLPSKTTNGWQMNIYENGVLGGNNFNGMTFANVYNYPGYTLSIDPIISTGIQDLQTRNFDITITVDYDTCASCGVYLEL